MSEATVRAALKIILESVTDVGVVHDYERWASEWDDFLALFKTTIGDNDVLRGWTIGYSGFSPVAPQEFGSRYHREHSFKIRGYMVLDDSEASEKSAAALAESVCDALDDAATIQHPNYYFAEDVTLLFEPRVFGGALVHYAEISVSVTEQRT